MTATLTNQIPGGGGGSALLSSGGPPSVGQSTTWTRTSAPPTGGISPDYTVIGWVDASKITLPTPQTPDLATRLNGGKLACYGLVATWALSSAYDINGPTDSVYASDWLLIHSANSSWLGPGQTPPSQISKLSVLTGGDFRIFSDFQVQSGSSGSNVVSAPPVIGNTIDPCGYLPSAPPQVSSNNGAIGVDALGRAFQLAEGRIGSIGQAVNQTINGTTSTPWIWSVTEINSAGNPVVPFDHAMFPSYSIYRNGYLLKTCTQSNPVQFIGLLGSYQRSPSQIPVQSGAASCQ